MSSTPVPRAPSTALELSDEILDVLDDVFVTSHSGGCRPPCSREESSLY